jgi:hypothetical protein
MRSRIEMSVQTLSPVMVAEAAIEKPSAEKIQPVRSRLLRWILYGMPWVILALVAIEARLFYDPLFFSAQVAAALALFAFQVLMRRIPQTFDALWDRNLIEPKPPDRADSTTLQATLPASTDDEELARRYGDFIKNIDRWLNHRRSLLLGAVFAVLILIRAPYEYEQYVCIPNNLTASVCLDAFGRALVDSSWQFRLEIGAEGLIGFILGLMAWRMIVTARKVDELDDRFDLKLQLDHPDGAGGLAPLGTLCLWNALIITIPGIFLGGWILLMPSFKFNCPYPTAPIAACDNYLAYLPLYYFLLLVPVTFAPLTFLAPLWSVHELMIAKSAAPQRELAKLAERIDTLARDLLDRADKLDPAEGEKMVKNLEFMRQTYVSNQNIPTWPFNTQTALRFVTSQAIPILGLTPLKDPVVKVVDSLLGFFK